MVRHAQACLKRLLKLSGGPLSCDLFPYKNDSQIANKIFSTKCFFFADQLKHKIVN